MRSVAFRPILTNSLALLIILAVIVTQKCHRNITEMSKLSKILMIRIYLYAIPYFTIGKKRKIGECFTHIIN